MEPMSLNCGKRSKNFTEREKMLLIELAKEFVSIIDNKKTDSISVESKKHAWAELTKKFNSVSVTGIRNEKQLHALYDTLKKKARKNIKDDKCEMYKTEGGTFSPKTTEVYEKIVELITPQFKPLSNEFDSSVPCYELVTDNETKSNEDEDKGAQPQNFPEDLRPSISNIAECTSKTVPSHNKDLVLTRKKKNLTETKKTCINRLSASIIKRKNKKQINEEPITTKKLQILEVQLEYEKMNLKNKKILNDMDIELKKVVLESAKLDLEIKKKNYNLQ